MKKPELLSPVQDFVSLKAAIDAGADAIYFGAKEMNMRINAKNFEAKNIKKVISICHKNKVRAYCTLNTIMYDDDTIKLKKILRKLKKEKIDAIIAWDFAVIAECEKLNLSIHLSTQASISNFDAVKSLKNKFKNIKRINLARELSLTQIKNIIKKIKQNKLNVEIETFIHGAMCVSVSGRCFLSQELFNRSANRGDCLQPCRRKYLIKDVEEGHELNLGEDYIISPKDLCTINILDRLMEANIDAFKIEGRNRSPEYVKVTTECYREAIDALSNTKGARGWGTSLNYIESRKRLFPPLKNNKNNKLRIAYNEKLKNKLIKKLKTVYNRGFSTGFYLGKPINEWSNAYGSKATKKKIYLGKVLNFYKKVQVAELLLQTHSLKLNDEVMFQGNKTGVVNDTVTSMEIKNRKAKKAKKDQRVGIKLKNIVRANDKVFLMR
jgi:putative protease